MLGRITLIRQIDSDKREMVLAQKLVVILAGMKLQQLDQKTARCRLAGGLLQLSQNLFEMMDGVIAGQCALGQKGFQPDRGGIQHVLPFFGSN